MWKNRNLGKSPHNPVDMCNCEAMEDVRQPGRAAHLQIEGPGSAEYLPIETGISMDLE
jgi:hypothetical protein